MKKIFPLVHQSLNKCLLKRSNFVANQDAKKEYSLCYTTDEQRSLATKELLVRMEVLVGSYLMGVALTILFAFLSVATLQAQELNFQVAVNTSKSKARIVDPKVFESLEQSIQEFLNNTKWTADVFELEERIKGNIVININEERSATQFTADLSIQATRPVYGSDYETPLVTLQDNKVWFDYEQFQPLIFSESNYNDHLTALLAFYVYTIIGMDYDSFSPLGGDAYFKKAQDVVTNIPPGVAGIDPKGWRAVDGNRNRYWMAENMLSPRIRPFRQAMYDYHRQGLDIMSEDVNAGRGMIATALETVSKVNRAYPNAMIMQTFSDTKTVEITDIFQGGTLQEKNKVIQVMTRIDAARAAKYRAIR